jgi:hypothetical protein
MSPLNAKEALTARLRHSSFRTGSIPGSARSTKLALVFACSNCEHNESADNDINRKNYLTRKKLMFCKHLTMNFESHFDFVLLEEVGEILLFLLMLLK